MNIVKFGGPTLALLGALSLVGCNSGGGSDTQQVAPSSNKMSSGVITGTKQDSITVNGVSYKTSSATVTMDGSASTPDNLGVGMVVSVDGTVDANGTTGTASQVEYKDELEGIVTDATIDPNSGTGTLTVMGQTVNVDADTTFESHIDGITTVADVKKDNIVEVSGYSNGDGTIYATRVEVKKAMHEHGEEIEVKGTIKDTVTDSTFEIGTLTVFYDTSTVMDSLPNKKPEAGLYVEVKSVVALNADGQLVASKIELEGDGKRGHDGKEGDQVEMEGVVTAVTAPVDPATTPSDFMLNGKAVKITTDTVFDNGHTAADIAEGVKLEVKGTIDAEGTLVADKIEFRMKAEIEMKAMIDAIDADTNNPIVLGQTIAIDALTKLHGESNMANATANLTTADLAAGDCVEVRAYMDANSQLVATKLERIGVSTVNMGGATVDMCANAKLKGPVDADIAADSTTMTVAGVNVDFSVDSTFTAAAGDKVEIKGTYDATTGVLTAKEISKEGSHVIMK